MKIKKQILKTIQIGTLFIFSSASFLGVISFSNPEITLFHTFRNLDFLFGVDVFADDDDYYEDEDDDYNKIQNQNISKKVTGNSQQNLSNTSLINCKIVNETVFDTITSASGITSTVPRVVSHKVCDTVVNEPQPKATMQEPQNKPQKKEQIIPKGLSENQKTTLIEKIDLKFLKLTTKEKLDKIQQLEQLVGKAIDSINLNLSNILDNDLIFKLKSKLVIYTDIKTLLESEISKLSSKLSILTNSDKKILYNAKNGKTYTIIDDGKTVKIQKSDGSYAKQSFSSYADAISYLDKNTTIQSQKAPLKQQITKTIVTKNNTPTNTIKASITTTTTTSTSQKPKVDTTTKAS